MSPTLDDLPVGNSPNYDSREFDPLPRGRLGPGPMIPNHHFVVLGNQVFDPDSQVGNLLQGFPDVLDRACGPWRQSRWYVRSVIDEIRREIHLSDSQVIPVHEFFEMIPDEFLHFGMRHARLGIIEFGSSR
jgi:hypothetical protein